MTPTITTAATIGRRTSLVPAAFAGGIGSPSVGLGVAGLETVGAADSVGGADTGELGVGGRDGGGVTGALTVNVNVPVSRWPSSANDFHWTS